MLLLYARTGQSTVLGNSMSVSHGNGVMLQVKLLQFVRPQDFDNFKHFVRWRDTTANILLQILQRAAQVPASEDDKYGCWLALICRTCHYSCFGSACWF